MGYYGRLSEAEQAVMAAEFMDFAAPLLEHPDVQGLSRNLHHRGKTRLEHVKEVAWLSFCWGKRFSLDCQAIVRVPYFTICFSTIGSMKGRSFTASDTTRSRSQMPGR